MGSMRSIMPIPVWLVIVMLIMGIGAGFGLGWVITHQPIHVKSEARQMELKPKRQQTKKPAAVLPKPQKKTDPGDKRLVANMTSGPVRRAIQDSIRRIKPAVDSCHKENYPEPAKRPERFMLILELEAIGGMATVLNAEAQHPIGNDRDVQACILKNASQMLIDFRVEDGTYSVLQPFTYPRPKPPIKKTTK